MCKGVKHEIQNIKKHVCDHNALIFGFYLKKRVTDFFGVGGTDEGRFGEAYL